MPIHKVTTTELKNHLGAYLEAAIAAPVIVEKSGREVAVLISREHYTHLQALEDRWWGEQAKLAASSAAKKMLAAVELVVAAGPESIVVSGVVVSGGATIVHS